MYEKLIRSMKRTYASLLIFLGIMIVCVIGSMIAAGIHLLVPILFTAAILGVFAYFIYKAYRNVDKNAKLLQDELGIQSDEEFNILLENSDRLSTYVFLTKTHLIVFNKFLSFELQKIGYIEKTCRSDEDSTTYYVAVSVGKGIKEISFPNERKRDAAYNAICTAMGNGTGDKRLW